jgi:hypothetical protein
MCLQACRDQENAIIGRKTKALQMPRIAGRIAKGLLL